MFNSLIVFTGRKCPFLGCGRAFLGDLVPKMLCKMQLRKKLFWFNWFYLILFYRYSRETWLERDAKKKKKKKKFTCVGSRHPLLLSQSVCYFL